MFFTGQKVVCIEDLNDLRNYRKSPYIEIIPEKDGIYTIRQIIHKKFLCFRLVEIINPPYRYLEGISELMFYSSFFRPLVTRKTSIEIFERMLTPNEEKV